MSKWTFEGKKERTRLYNEKDYLYASIACKYNGFRFVVNNKKISCI